MLVIAATEPELAGVSGARTLVCGVGPVDAAFTTALALVRQPPDAVLHVGLAGKHGFEEPELVIGSESRYCDTDSRLVKATVVPDADLLVAVRKALPSALVCPIGTSARVNGTTNCLVEAMEGFAVLRACELAGVPAVELRVTANEITEPDRSKWRFGDALDLLAATLPPLLEELRATR